MRGNVKTLEIMLQIPTPSQRNSEHIDAGKKYTYDTYFLQ